MRAKSHRRTSAERLRATITARQAAFRESLKPHRAEMLRTAEKNVALLYAFIYRRLSRMTLREIGGFDAAKGEFALTYMIAVRNWFSSRRKLSLSTFVCKQCLWDVSRIFKDREIIKTPTVYERKQLSGKHADAIRSLAAECDNVIRFHGSEGRCESSALLTARESEAIGSEMANALKDAIGNLFSRQKLAVRLRFGFECDPLSLEEIGEVLDVTTERARQIIITSVCRIERYLQREHRALLAEL